MLYWCLHAAICQGQGSKMSVYPWSDVPGVQCGLSQLSLPEGSCQNWLSLKQPSKCLTIHVWFPSCRYSLSGEEGLEVWHTINLRLRPAQHCCPRPSGPGKDHRPRTVHLQECSSVSTLPVVSHWDPCVLAPEQEEVF